MDVRFSNSSIPQIPTTSERTSKRKRATSSTTTVALSTFGNSRSKRPRRQATKKCCSLCHGCTSVPKTVTSIIDHSHKSKAINKPQPIIAPKKKRYIDPKDVWNALKAKKNKIVIGLLQDINHLTFNLHFRPDYDEPTLLRLILQSRNSEISQALIRKFPRFTFSSSTQAHLNEQEVWTLCQESVLPTELIQQLKIADFKSFNINYHPVYSKTSYHSLTIFNAICKFGDLDLLHSLVDRFPDINFNHVSNGSSFTILLDQLLNDARLKNDPEFAKSAALLIEKIVTSYPEININAFGVNSETPGTGTSTKNALSELHLLRENAVGEAKALFANIIASILENFPRANPSCLLLHSLTHTEYLPVILQHNRYNSMRLPYKEMIESKNIAEEFYPQLINHAYEFKKQNPTHEFDDTSLASLLYKTDESVAMQNLACLYMGSMLRIPLAPSIEEQMRCQLLKRKLQEWEDSFRKMEVFYQANSLLQSDGLPLELFEEVLLSAFTTDPAMKYVPSKIIKEKFYKRCPALVAIVNLSMKRLEKTFEKKWPSTIINYKRIMYARLQMAINAREEKVILSPSVRAALVNNISEGSHEKDHRITHVFLKNVLASALKAPTKTEDALASSLDTSQELSTDHSLISPLDALSELGASLDSTLDTSSENDTKLGETPVSPVGTSIADNPLASALELSGLDASLDEALAAALCTSVKREVSLEDAFDMPPELAAISDDLDQISNNVELAAVLSEIFPNQSTQSVININ